MKPNEVKEYHTKDGISPFGERLSNMRDSKAVARIAACVTKMQAGLLGDWKKAGDGNVKESRIDYGPGYRVYFALDGGALVILLLCGDKGTQDKDIKVAYDYWQDYKSRK